MSSFLFGIINIICLNEKENENYWLLEKLNNIYQTIDVGNIKNFYQNSISYFEKGGKYFNSNKIDENLNEKEPKLNKLRKINYNKSFDIFNKEFKYLKKIYDKVININEYYINIIENILKESEFNIEDLNCDCNFLFDNEKNKNNLDELIKIKYFIIEDENNQINNNIKENNNIFSDLINEIEIILNLIKEIYSNGFSDKIIIKIKIENKKVISIDFSENKNIKSLNDIKNKLKIIIQQQNFELNKFYEKTYQNKLIFGNYFSLIFNFIISKNNNDNLYNFIFYLCKYLTNNITNINDIFKYKILKNQNENKINYFYEKIDNFTVNLFNNNKIKLENIYSQSKIVKNIKKGIYKFQNQKNVEISILKLFYFLTNNFPIAQNILLCNEFTEKSEINSFLF